MRTGSWVVRAVAAWALTWFYGLAGAATPLVIPVTSEEVRAKSLTELAVRFNREGVETLKSGAEVELALPNGSKHDYVFEHLVSHGGGITTWVARSPLSGDNERAIITYGPHGAWGWMKTTHGDYRIYPSGKGYDLIARREKQNLAPKFSGGDAREVPPDEPAVAAFTGVPTILPPSLMAKSIFAKATPAPVLQSDVMLLYTKDLAQKLGVGLMPMLYNLIASANQAYADSEIAISLRLVNATMIDWPNTNASDDTLDGMGGFGANAAFFQSLTWGGATSLRNTVGADFVALVRDGPTDTGGIGNLPKNPVVYPISTVTSSSGYSVNNFCASGCEGIFAHEVGHNMGMHHDPGTVAQDANGALPLGTGVFSFAYGYYSCAGGTTCNPYTPGGCPDYAQCAGNNANDFGTVMSYFNPRVMKFSNPLLSTCVPAGGNAGAPRACGGAIPSQAPVPATTSDNALAMNNVRGAISAYRAQTITSLPGSVQFTNTAFSGGEGSNIAFTVSRTGGSSGSVTVSYTVTAGTATAGGDYTVANGTLTWTPGDSANQTINVATTVDALVEGVETLSVTLSNPTGAPGVFVGYPNEATGLILEPWPVGPLAALPTEPASSWSSPASPASSVAWSIANDSAPAGDPDGRSLKSGLIDFAVRNCTDATNGAVPCPSAVELTRNFSAGTVSFAYRLSAFFFFGVFEFLVDGTVVHTTTGDPANAVNGGDTGWRQFSTTLTAGNHTLKWQYRPRLSFACSAGTVGGQPYPGCQDRAWIDQLALPANTVFANPPRLVTIATRMQVLTGDDVMIGGFVIGGSQPKTVVVRARGPSLTAAGVPGAMTNPFLQLFSGASQIAANDNFGTAGNLTQLNASGFAPSNSQESAILTTLNPGAYTAIVSGAGGTTGVGIVEVFEVDAFTVPLINIATRGRVQSGDNVMIGGFVIQGTGPQTVVVRARGPSLAAAGVAGTLANPNLQLFSGATEIAANNDWGTAANHAAITAAGFAPSETLESAIMMTLNPGAYTAIVSGVGGTTGVAIVEVFTVP